MNGNKKGKRAFLLLTALLCACAVLYVLYQNGAFLPRWISWKSGMHDAQSGQYEISLQNKSVTVFYENAPIWTSPTDIRVQAALSCDIDRDQHDELLLLCWKRGRYGKQKPFWIDRDERTWSQHIFVYQYDTDTIRPKWMSSYIGQDVSEMTVKPDDAARNHLFLTDPTGKITSWIWDSWGFTKENTEVSFVVFGDNLMHEPIYRYGLQNETGFHFLFENVRDLIAKSDIAVLNQETPLIDDPSRYSDYPRFGTPLKVGEAIASAGLHVVTCATNHALDQGPEGIRCTKDFFTSQNILCLGIQTGEETAYRPYETIEKNGIRFALLNYTYGVNGIQMPEASPHMVHLLTDEAAVRRDIAQAKADSDFVIVFVHWGTEYAAEPDDFQQKWAQLFLSCQVDAVVGTHPHTLQPCELVRDENGHEMLLYYSLGNFVSAQPEKTCTRGGMASFTVSLTADGYKITSYDLQPLTITRETGGRYTVAP